MLKTLFFLFSILFYSGITPGLFSQEYKKTKGLWITREHLKDKGKIAELVDSANRAGFNTIFVQVRGRGDAFYNSSFVPRAEVLQGTPDFDPLEYIIRIAKIYKLKIHAWFNIFYLWSSDNLPDDKNHLINIYSDWACRDYNGISMINFKQKKLRKKGIEGIFLSPDNKEVQDYIISVLKEVIEKYRIDGIHLDYIRYPAIEFGFNERIKKIYTDR
ncbi:hypothetical protein DRQ09_00420, partial [candidate division KSB1 bacterium]